MSEIKTYSRILFDPVHPDIDKIDIRDIAHALSLMCRANGHFPTFYSVAQHSMNCMYEAKARGYSAKVQLACLLHDASEAYLSDITRPVKKELPRYLEIETPLQNMIWEKYMGEALTEEEYKQVFDIDDTILYYEFAEMMDERNEEQEPELASHPEFECRDFAEVEQEFVRSFECVRYRI